MIPNREQVVKVIIGLVSTGILISLLVGCRLADFPFSVPSRSVRETEEISLLWIKEIDIRDPHYAGGSVGLFTPNNQSVVFWYPSESSLVALDLVTGETLWEAKVPDHSVTRLHDNKLFIVSHQWFDLLENAHVSKNQIFPNCSWGGKASLLTYDPYTGEILWGYVYHGVDSNEIYFEDQSVYLTGSNDHGNSRSIAKISANSGELEALECNKWPAKKAISSPPEDEGHNLFPYRVVYEERDLRWRDILLFFVPEGNRLNILDGSTKESLGHIDFDGAELNPYHIDMAVQNDLAVVYFGDSKQLFSLRLPYSVDLTTLQEKDDNKTDADNGCRCD